jgi:hypothetical protein
MLRREGWTVNGKRVRRLMRERGFKAPQRAGHAQGPKAHDGAIPTDCTDGETNDSWCAW